MIPACSTSQPEDPSALATDESRQEKPNVIGPSLDTPLDTSDSTIEEILKAARWRPENIARKRLPDTGRIRKRPIEVARKRLNEARVFPDEDEDEEEEDDERKYVSFGSSSKSWDSGYGGEPDKVDPSMNLDDMRACLPELPAWTPKIPTQADSHEMATGRNISAEDLNRASPKQADDTSDIVESTLPIPGEFFNRQEADSYTRIAGTPSSQSCSGSAMTALSCTTDSDIAATMMATRGAQDVSEKLLAFFCRFLELKLGVMGFQQAGSSSSTRNHRNQQELTGGGRSQSQTSKGKGKRVFEGDDSFDHMGEAPDDEEPEAKRNKSDNQKIACPYMKRFPTEFGTWRTCVGPGFDGIHRMKEHLKRRHFKDNGCHRCGLHLDSNEALQEHLRAADICPIREILPQMGFMTQTQREHISKKRPSHTTSLLERWKEIYLILFPDADENSIPSPYFDASEISDGLSNIFDPQEYECFLKQHLPARILMNLNREFQIISDLAKAKLAEMLQEESLEVLKAYVLQKGGSSSQTLQTDSSGSEQLDPGAIDNGLFDNIEALGDEGQDAFDFSFLEAYCQQADKQGSEQADSGYGPSVM